MFWSKARELHELQSQLARLAQENQELQANNADLRAQLAEQSTAWRTKEFECDTLRQILRHLSAFSDTLGGSQQSLGSMAAVLREERAQAVQAAVASVASGEVTTEIAASLQQLAQLPTAVARRLVAMRMALKAARLAGQPAQALETAVLLAKHKAFTPAAAQSLLRSLSLEWLTQIRDQEALRRFWNGLPAFLREMPEVACETARRCQSLGGDVFWARQLLLPVWSRWMASPDDVSSGQSQRLVEVLLQTLASASVQEAREWLLRFEQGLQARPRDVQMLYLSGLACHQQQLWGKAQQYLQLAVSLGLPPTLARPAWVALAELAQQRGDPDAALQAWKQAALQA